MKITEIIVPSFKDQLKAVVESKVNIDIEEYEDGTLEIDISDASTDKIIIQSARQVIEKILEISNLEVDDIKVEEIDGDYDGDLSILITLPPHSF